jgi:hypothetical protein
MLAANVMSELCRVRTHYRQPQDAVVMMKPKIMGLLAAALLAV